MANNDIGFDPILGKLREIDAGGGTGGESYDFNTNEFNVTGDNYVSLKSVPASKVSGAVTGIEASVSGGTATITATGSTTSVPIVGTGGVDVRGNTTTGAVELDAKDLSDGTQSVSKDVKQARFVEYVTYATAATQNALTLLHFSDIHADTAALARIVAAGDALGSLVNDMICTGDQVNVYTNGSIASWWNPNVMTVIGNHDSANGSYVPNTLSMADRDAIYIAPFEANWGITHTSGTSYYYKDYATQKVRLIVLDAMLYMSNTMATEAAAQTSWLEGLLSSAITGDLHVVIALHAPKLFSPVVSCSFSKYDATIVDTTATSCTISDTITNAVATAKANGLKFIGYICGHTHQDYINDILGDGSQFAYCVTCASTTQEKWMPYSDQFRDATLDAFNLVTIDTAHTTVAIVRGGGANVDCMMRKRDMICINYSTGEIIDYSIPAAGRGLETEFGKLALARYTPVEVVESSPLTLKAGHSYRIDTGIGFVLNTETVPENKTGTGIIDITLSGSGTVSLGSGVVLSGTLSQNARNLCSVYFANGLTCISVLASIPSAGYSVTITTGTENGSLYYGLATSTVSTLTFNVSLSGQTADLNGAVTNGKKYLSGNGSGTIISGGISCTSTTQMQNLEMNGVVLSGGTLTVAGGVSGDIAMESGTTLVMMYQNAPSLVSGTSAKVMLTSGAIVDLTGNTNTTAIAPGGGIIVGSEVQIYPSTGSASAVEISGGTFTSITNGGFMKAPVAFTDNTTIRGNATIALGNNHIDASDKKLTLSGLTISGGSTPNFGAQIVGSRSGCKISATDCVFTGINLPWNARIGAIAVLSGGSAFLSGCTFANNKVASGGCHGVYGIGYLELYGCVFSANNSSDSYAARFMSSGGIAGYPMISGCVFESGQQLAFSPDIAGNIVGSNTIWTVIGTGSAVISSGASINLTNSMGPSGGIIVKDGGCIINGTSFGSAGGDTTYTSIVSSGGSAVAS